MSITEKDEQLIALLKANARTSVAELARKLDVSRTTIQDRLRRLEETGVIAGYGVRLGKAAGGQGIMAYVELLVEPRMTAGVVSALLKLPQVETLHTVSGKFDLVAIVRASTTERMDSVLDTIGEIEGVNKTESAIVLSTKADRR